MPMLNIKKPPMKLLSNTNIASIIGNQTLAAAIADSVDAGLKSPFVSMVGGETVWDIFQRSLDAAIRDIEQHPRGKLFRRLIEYGPPEPDEPKSLSSDNETILSDTECGLCVEFIYSHMINRFKSELSELLALEPCIRLVGQLRQNGYLPADIQLFWGETIQERRKFRITTGQGGMVRWCGYAKGADGLLVEQLPEAEGQTSGRVKISGVVEVKSMTYNNKKILKKIDQHIARLNGGVKLGVREWTADKLSFAPFKNIKKAESGLLRVMVLPSGWMLSRERARVQTDRGTDMVFSESIDPSVQTRFMEIEPDCWKIILAWSQEALNQAAYEMTFWYMSEVGRRVYAEKKSPQEWEDMVPGEAGCNSIKMMLYNIQLRCLSNRQKHIATRLYNVYCFGYPLGVDSDKILCPEDFPDEAS
jgi:hypothetical protein